MTTASDLIRQGIIKPSYSKYSANQSVAGLKVPVSSGNVTQGVSSSPYTRFKGNYGSGSSTASYSGSSNQGMSYDSGSVAMGTVYRAVGYPGQRQSSPNITVNVPEGARTLSDAELFNLQLENAVMMQQLGYKASFSGDEIVYSPQDYLTQYGQYGYEPSKLYYESDYQMAQAQQMASSQAWDMPQRGYYSQKGGYYPRYGYQTEYYSGYSQGYPYYNYYRNRRNNYYNGYGNNYDDYGYSEYRRERRW